MGTSKKNKYLVNFFEKDDKIRFKDLITIYLNCLILLRSEYRYSPLTAR